MPISYVLLVDGKRCPLWRICHLVELLVPKCKASSLTFTIAQGLLVLELVVEWYPLEAWLCVNNKPQPLLEPSAIFNWFDVPPTKLATLAFCKPVPQERVLLHCKFPVTWAPPLVVSNFLLPLWYKSTDPPLLQST